MMRGASGDECGKLLGQEYNRPAEAGVLKKPREATLTFNLHAAKLGHGTYYFTSPPKEGILWILRMPEKSNGFGRV
jgi:hypothetical protein